MLFCAFTGHRPMRFSFGYDEKDGQCLRLKKTLAAEINRFIHSGVAVFYTGMALGVDQWAAEIVLDMKKEQPYLRLIAVLPCETQADRWQVEQRERYVDILDKCDEVVALHIHYTRSCMFERDRYLVDRAGYLLAVYDGRENGGTAYTVKYAKQKNRRITAIHPDTLAVESFVGF